MYFSRYVNALLIALCCLLFGRAVNAAIVQAVSVGQQHQCAIVDGGAYCWGDNTSGKLGNGSTVSSSTPVPVTGLTSGVTAISVSSQHSCAIANSELYCWGNNSESLLGNNPSVIGFFSTTPKKVEGLSGVTSVSAGKSTCVVANGGVKCWGTDLGSTAVTGTLQITNTPTQVPGLESNVLSVSTGKSHACALINNGSVKCWGLNDRGQLGDATITNSAIPVLVQRYTSGFTGISVGSEKQSCGVMNGAAKCWGDNVYGQLGNGTYEHSRSPIAVTGLDLHVQSVSAGGSFSCAVSLGKVSCWGLNGAGQLGNNSNASSTTPVGTVSLDSFSFISTGEFRSCAITNIGVLKCWGAGLSSIPTEIIFKNTPPSQLQTINFSSIGGDKIFVAGDTFSVSATSSSGLPVYFSTTSAYNCTASGSTITMVNSGPCTVVASQPGNSIYQPANSVSQTLQMLLKTYKTQTVSISGELSQLLPINSTFSVAASASSGLPVILTSLTPSVCSVAGTTVKVLGAGRCELFGDQYGNDVYSAAYAQFNILIAVADTKSLQTISLNLGGSRVLGIGETFTINPLSSSGLPVSISVTPLSVCRSQGGTTITVVGAGICTIWGYQGGDNYYRPVNVTGDVEIIISNKKPQTITFLNNVPSLTRPIGSTFSINAISSSNLPVTIESLNSSVCSISGSLVTINGEGICSYRAYQTGDSSYLSASVESGTNIILLREQTVNLSFDSYSISLPLGERFVVKSATASSGLAVTISSLTPSVCTVSGTTVTVVGAGVCRVQGYQAGTTTITSATAIAEININTSSVPVLNMTPSGEVPIGTSVTVSLSPQSTLGGKLYFRPINGVFDERNPISFSSSFSFDMPPDIDGFIVAKAIYNSGTLSSFTNEIRIKSLLNNPDNLSVASNYVDSIYFPNVNSGIKKGLSNLIKWNSRVLDDEIVSLYILNDSSIGIDPINPSFSEISVKKMIQIAKSIPNIGEFSFFYSGVKTQPRVIVIGSKGKWSISSPSPYQNSYFPSNNFKKKDYLIQIGTDKSHYSLNEQPKLSVKTIKNKSTNDLFDLYITVGAEDNVFYFDGTRFSIQQISFQKRIQFPEILQWIRGIDIPLSWSDIGGYGRYKISVFVKNTEGIVVANDYVWVVYYDGANSQINTRYDVPNSMPSMTTRSYTKSVNGSNLIGKIETLAEGAEWAYRAYKDTEKIRGVIGLVNDYSELVNNYEDWKSELPSDYADNLLAISMILKLWDYAGGYALPTDLMLHGFKQMYSYKKMQEIAQNRVTWGRIYKIKLKVSDCTFICSGSKGKELSIYLYPMQTERGVNDPTTNPDTPFHLSNTIPHSTPEAIYPDVKSPVFADGKTAHQFEVLYRGLYLLEIRRNDNNAVVHRRPVLIGDHTIGSNTDLVDISEEDFDATDNNAKIYDFLPRR